MKNEQLVLRFYNERFNMDRDYYEGYTDLQQVMIYPSFENLKKNWEWMLESYEGETYSIRTNSDGYLLCGGAFDPDDIDLIEAALEFHKEKNDKEKKDLPVEIKTARRILKDLSEDVDDTLEGIARVSNKHNVSISVCTDEDGTTLTVTPWIILDKD